MWIPERVNKAGNGVPAFQVDECFAEEVRKHDWTVTKKGYMRWYSYSPEKKQNLLHRFIWSLSGREQAEHIDHINGDPLDNRLENLRNATPRLNAKNYRRRKKTKLGFPPGVKKSGGRFQAMIRHRTMKRYLGTYDTAEEASAVYQNAKEILIEFANLPGYENVLTGGIER